MVSTISLFSPIADEIIQFDLRISFKWLGEKTTSFSKAKEMEMKKKEEMIEAEASQGGEL